MLDKMTKAGPRIHAWLSKVKSRIKYLLLPNVLFEELGFTYLGPVSGHDIQSLTEALNLAKKVPNPVLLHVLTVKGKGLRPGGEGAEQIPRHRKIRPRYRQESRHG